MVSTSVEIPATLLMFVGFQSVDKQWGNATAATGSGMVNTSINFPISFSNAYKFLFMHDYKNWTKYNTDWHSFDRNYGTSSRALSGCTVIGYNVVAGSFDWIAIGY